ncbi:MAG: NAD(P)-binding domain-containing protein [Leptospirillia bacterium]
MDTIIIGNGPAGICLSLFLSGWWPYYKGGHPDPELDRRLTDGSASLFERGLLPLYEGLEGRSDNPAALLFDRLHHPAADTPRVLPSTLELKRRPDRAVPHMVLGSGYPGGSWHRMPAKMRSLSPGNWMELPGWSLFEWARSEGRWIDPNARIARSEIANYYRAFVARMKLGEHFRSGVRVVAARPTDTGWEVDVDADGKVSTHACRNLVLACGMYDRPNTLGIPGEDLGIVTHRTPETGTGTLLVVGSGLSAADAILFALDAGRQVVHVFFDEVEATPMAGLLRSIYPEYRNLTDWMEGAPAEHYQAFSGGRLTEVGEGGYCIIEGPEGRTVCQVDQVAVLVGSTPDLSFMPPGTVGSIEPLPVNPFNFHVGPQGLYAIGPLAGDNFVRFITGHGFAVAHDLIGSA